ncbi:MULTISPECIES: hypothetical protein [unclassified Salinibacterium]|uniref:PH-like domain-containing protein n=1 Tax=unclassified Salinibacterium TaxID=2632331 RepID=UPI00141F19F6|nr:MULTISPECIES: hypothetical protein [unclassified Salinibacterium]
MDRTFWAAITIGILALLLALMLLGWRARGKRQAGLATPEAAPSDVGSTLIDTPALYVGTTVAGEPLNRVTAKGLGFRARATLTVAEAGLVLAIPGQTDLFIARDRITGAGRATWTIDRTVEPDGLLMIGWLLGDAPVESYFRLTGDASLDEVIRRIANLRSAHTEPASTEPAPTESESA